MGKITENIAIIVGTQSGQGSVNTTTRDATTVTAANGIRYVAKSIKFTPRRIEAEVPDKPGSLSRQQGDFLRTEVDLSFDIDLKGSGTASPSTDGDYQLPTPIENVFKGAGLTGAAWGSGTGYEYTLGALTLLTFKVWRGGQSWTLMDCRVNIDFSDFTAGEKSTATVEVKVGSVSEFDAADAFPTSIAYGAQETTKAPVLGNSTTTVEGVSKGFLSGSITLDNKTQEVPDSNAPDGTIIESAGRSVDVDFQFWSDDSDADQEYTQLVATSQAETVDFKFVLGTAGDSDEANALRFRVRGVQFDEMDKVEEYKRIIWGLTGYGTGFYGTDTEFAIVSQ